MLLAFLMLLIFFKKRTWEETECLKVEKSNLYIGDGNKVFNENICPSACQMCGR